MNISYLTFDQFAYVTMSHLLDMSDDKVIGKDSFLSIRFTERKSNDYRLLK